MIAYDLWPQLTRCAALSRKLVKAQLWLWFVGMMVLTMPWHWVGLLGMPRRMAYYDYTHPALHPQAWTVVASTIGGLLLVGSALLFVYILAKAKRDVADPAAFTFSLALHGPARAPALLNGYALWVAMMIALTIINYGYPIAQLASLADTAVPAIRIGDR
jgi:cytochrome c oxidase subunit 1